MSQYPSWSDEVSDHVMDAQVIAMKMVRSDGVVTPAEQELLDALKAEQERITDVDEEMVKVVKETTQLVTRIRTGRRPRRMVRACAEPLEAA